MNNMYDILNKFNSVAGKQTLTEGARPDFLDLDKDGDRKEPIKQAAKQAKHKDQVDEISMDQIGRGIGKAIGVPARIAGAVAGIPGGLKQAYQTSKAGAQKAISGQDVDCYPKTSKVAEGDVEEGSTGDYSAKKARAGKDIGKPGKQFAKIAADAAERYGSKERGEKVAGAVLAKLRAKESIDEADVEEGNEFSGARMAAIRAGKPTFTVDGKTYRVSGDTSDEKVMEREFTSRDEFDRRAEKGDTVRTTQGTLTKTDRGVRHERRADDETDADDRDDDTPKKKGRPKGSKRAIGAKGPTGKSKLLNKKSIKEDDLEEDYDRDEYDEEGEMAKSQARTIEDAAKELQDILSDDENLPEWVQSKITKALDYIDTARDYMAATRPEEEMMAEKAVSKAQRAAAGIAYAAKKGDIPKSELRGASKEMAKMASGELKKFAKTKEKGLPEKVAKDESVEETTVSGSVATSTETPKGKKGMIFGKGVYESQLAESFENKLQMLTEGMSINMSVGENGEKNLSVTASDDDAVKLAQILKLAGMESSGYESACPACGSTSCGCDEGVAEGEYANSPDVEESDTDTLVNGLSGGLNGPKLQVNPNNIADNPLAMQDLGKGPSTKQINLGKVAEDVTAETETRLMDLYKRIS